MTSSDLSIILKISNGIYLQHVELYSIPLVTVVVRALFIVLPGDVCLQHIQIWNPCLGREITDFGENLHAFFSTQMLFDLAVCNEKDIVFSKLLKQTCKSLEVISKECTIQIFFIITLKAWAVCNLPVFCVS